MSTLVRPNIVTNGLVLHLDAANIKSYPRSGTTWNDMSGNGNNATLINGPTFNNLNGGSILFNGSNNYSTGSINTLNDFTTIYSVYSTDISSQNIFYPLGLSFSGGVGGVYFGGNLAPYANKAGLHDGTTTLITNSTITANTWYTIAAIRNSTTSSIYINGKLDNTGSISSNTITSYGLGRRIDGVWYYKGNISLTQIYNRALSATEVLQNYNATKTRFGLT